jgi:phospholipid/cholesterol/gamma-HCH transport system permease protein
MVQSEERTLPDILPFRVLSLLGEWVLGLLEHIGSALLLFLEAMRWAILGTCTKKVRLGSSALVSQIIRVGIRSIGIVSLVSGCVGLILALQLAPPLDDFGRKDLVANIISVAVLRELGPLIGAIVLTGFAGASIAAEIGTMVVSEEIEALEAHALNPVRFLVTPRVLASIISMTCLAVIAVAVAIIAALYVSNAVLGIPFSTFISNMLDQAKTVDFVTGVIKGAVFGLLIGTIACTNGMKVSGGAAGVGKATTGTVVQSVVAIVIADLAFTAVFYALGLV